jgi:hypothetical protein
VAPCEEAAGRRQALPVGGADRTGEKAPAVSFHAGTLGEGMRAAIFAVRAGYKEMIDGWRAT